MCVCLFAKLLHSTAKICVRTFAFECKNYISMLLCLFATLQAFISQIFSFASECLCKRMQKFMEKLYFNAFVSEHKFLVLTQNFYKRM